MLSVLCNCADAEMGHVMCAGQPRIGARPVTVTYSSGAGAVQTDTSTSSSTGTAQTAAAEDTGEIPVHHFSSVPPSSSFLC
jgi:hypothetical protein